MIQTEGIKIKKLKNGSFGKLQVKIYNFTSNLKVLFSVRCVIQKIAERKQNILFAVVFLSVDVINWSSDLTPETVKKYLFQF